MDQGCRGHLGTGTHIIYLLVAAVPHLWGTACGDAHCRCAYASTSPGYSCLSPQPLLTAFAPMHAPSFCL